MQRPRELQLRIPGRRQKLQYCPLRGEAALQKIISSTPENVEKRVKTRPRRCVRSNSDSNTSCENFNQNPCRSVQNALFPGSGTRVWPTAGRLLAALRCEFGRRLDDGWGQSNLERVDSIGRPPCAKIAKFFVQTIGFVRDQVGQCLVDVAVVRRVFIRCSTHVVQPFFQSFACGDAIVDLSEPLLQFFDDGIMCISQGRVERGCDELHRVAEPSRGCEIGGVRPCRCCRRAVRRRICRRLQSAAHVPNRGT